MCTEKECQYLLRSAAVAAAKLLRAIPVRALAISRLAACTRIPLGATPILLLAPIDAALLRGVPLRTALVGPLLKAISLGAAAIVLLAPVAAHLLWAVPLWAATVARALLWVETLGSAAPVLAPIISGAIDLLPSTETK